MSVDLKPIKDQLESDRTIFVLFGQNPTVDHVAASLGLYLVFKEAGKDVMISSPSELRAEFSRLVGLNKIGKTVGNRNLVISFPKYAFENIDKVSVSDNKPDSFELIIQPKSGKKSPDPATIDYSYRGADASLIFAVGVSRLEDLGSIYESERKLFTDATVVAFNRRQNPTYASISVVDQSASSLSEIVAEFIDKLGLAIQGDTASNFLAGIDYATNRFQNPVISANAFLTAGKLLQNGAKRQPPTISSASQMTGGTPFGPFRGPGPQRFPKSGGQRPLQSPQPGRPQPPQAQPQASQAPKPQPKRQAATQPDKSQKQPPKDWLEPKIYKGSTKV